MYSAFVAWGTLNSRRAVSPLVRLVGGEERWKDPVHPLGVLPKYWGGTKQNRTVICMVLKAKANDKHKNLALRRDKFRVPWSDATVDEQQQHILLLTFILCPREL
ncbi:uncharacterized protein TNCV_3998171 [Trichonephila clavipes]|nr:uncharacterized protein TNCV_3998171 [Trichonephila clavipes]